MTHVKRMLYYIHINHVPPHKFLSKRDVKRIQHNKDLDKLFTVITELAIPRELYF